jgi:hypothetical protein
VWRESAPSPSINEVGKDIKMFSFLRRLFRAKPAQADDDIVQEFFESDFSNPKRSRFREEEEERYSVTVGKGRLELALNRPRLFAWTENPVHRYADFMVEGDISFAPGDASPAQEPPAGAASDSVRAAAGFLFRYSNEGHFYSVMLSDSGQLRIDAVFNGTPRTLVAWTDTGSGSAERFVLTLIARGARICAMVNGLWAR